MTRIWRRSLSAAGLGFAALAVLAGSVAPPGAAAPARTVSVVETAAPPVAQGPASSGGEAAGVAPAAAALRFLLASAGLPTSGAWKVVPALADVNGDRIPDLAAPHASGGGHEVWLGTKEGMWVAASRGLRRRGSCGGAVQFADVNKDGHLDLVVADHCSGVWVYLGDGQGRWQAVARELQPAPTPEGEVPGGMDGGAVGDVNEDGFPDIVASASNEGGFTVWLGDGSGRVWKEVTEPDGLPSAADPEPGDRERGGNAPEVRLVDVDKDGHLDVVAAFYTGPRVWRGDGKGRWRPASKGLPILEGGGLYFRIAVGDVNGDGRVDLVAGHMTKSPQVFLQEKDGTWRPSPSPALASLQSSDAVALADLDGDGHLDLVVGGRRGARDRGLLVFRGNGKGEWTETETNLPARGYRTVWGITAGDTNGDGALDLVVTTADYPTFVKDRAAGTAPTPPRPLGPQPQIQVWLRVKG